MLPCAVPSLALAPDAVTPHLPIELVWLIVEQTLIQTRKDSTSFAAPSYLLTLNRVVHALVTKIVYRTIVLTSSPSLAKFLQLLVSSPTVPNLVQNIWIGTSHLEAFPHPIGWASCAVHRILEKTTNLQRLALPSAFLPLQGIPNHLAIRHLSVNGGRLVQSPNGLNTLHLYGLARPEFGARSVTRVVCELKRPYAPGAVGEFVRGLLEQKNSAGLVLELVVPEKLWDWFDEEWAGVPEKYSQGIWTVQLTRIKCGTESPCDKWVWGRTRP